VPSTTVKASDARARANVYAFLASLFSTHPTQATVRAVREMAEDLALNGLEPSALEELEREYMDLFVVPNPRYVAPYESVYCDQWMPVARDGEAPADSGSRRGLLMGDSSLQVRQCYEEAGVVPDEALPDHIATELRFMAWLWDQQAVRDVSGAAVIARLRERFRADHLERWIGPLRDEVAERDRVGFYVAALSLTEAVLQSDSA
jgi:putative dimethyl sulfoxide reductase chaperone